MLGGAMAIAAAVVGTGWASAILPTWWVDVVEVDSGIGTGKTAIQLTDIHIEMLRVQPERIAKICQQYRPDYLFLTGDFVTRDGAVARLRPLLSELAKQRIPIYATLGNHDYHLRHRRRLTSLLESYSIRLLRNAAVRLDGFWLVGIDDACTRHDDVEAAFRDVPEGETCVVITHDPNVVLRMHRRYDWLMAGHLHGKQFRIPGLFQIKDMGALPRKGIYQGKHVLSQGPLYISKGLSQVGVNLRFLVRCEITVHHL